MANESERIVDVGIERKATKFLFQNAVVGRQDIVAGDELGDLETLVHGLLDQRITAQGADHVQASDVGLVMIREFGQRRRVITWKCNTAVLDKTPRRDSAESRDNAATLNARLTGLGIEHDRSACVDRCDAGVVETRDRSILDSTCNQPKVAFFGTRKFVTPVDDNYGVVSCQRNGVFDGRVAGANNDDGLGLEFIRIVQRVLDASSIFARDAKLTRIALQTDRKNDGFRLHHLAIGKR